MTLILNRSPSIIGVYRGKMVTAFGQEGRNRTTLDGTLKFFWTVSVSAASSGNTGSLYIRESSRCRRGPNEARRFECRCEAWKSDTASLRSFLYLVDSSILK